MKIALDRDWSAFLCAPIARRVASFAAREGARIGRCLEYSRPGVQGGAIIADDVDLPDGTVVTVIVEGPAEDDYDTLSAEEEADS